MKDKRIVLDTNIFTKALTKEDDSEVAVKLLKKLKSEKVSVHAPFFMKVEFSSTIRKKWYLGEFNKTKGLKILDVFSRLDVIFVEEDWELLTKSMLLADKTKQTTVYDCIFLVLAKKLKVDFVSDDNKFLKEAKKVYKKSFNMREYLKTRE